jgi:hypothetical protein
MALCRDTLVLFTKEEFERLMALASVKGVANKESIRAFIFGQQEEISPEVEDLTTKMALLEGVRIRSRQRRRRDQD